MASLPENERQHRPCEIELLLDSKRPQMQQRLQLGGAIEVAGLGPENYVRYEGRSRTHVLSQLLELIRQQRERAEQEAGGQYENQSGEYAPDAACIKVREAEGGATQLPQDDARDQETRDDEEHVDADESAGNVLREGVKADHHQDCYAA